MNNERIIFEGERLPESAWWIDVLASSNIIADIDEELSRWFWRFRICAGCTKTEESTNILKFSKELQNLLDLKYESIRNNYIQHCKNNESFVTETEIDIQLTEWRTTLKTLIDKSSNSLTCSWFGED